MSSDYGKVMSIRVQRDTAAAFVTVCNDLKHKQKATRDAIFNRAMVLLERHGLTDPAPA